MNLVSLLLFPGVVSTAAHAFQPEPGVTVGPEPTRIRRTHVEQQHKLRHAPAWQDFVAGEGTGWLARFDERTGTPRRAWGPGIDLGVIAQSSESDVADALMAFFDRNEALIGVPSDQLALARAIHVEPSDHWIVRFDQVVPSNLGEEGALLAETADWHGLSELAEHGDPVVWRGGVTAHFRYGRLIMLGIDTYPDTDRVDLEPTLGAQTAIEVAMDEGPFPDAAHEVEGAVLAVLPLEVPGGLEYRATWVVRTRTLPENGDPPGLWVSFVDADSGELLNTHNQVRFLDGAVYGTHDTRTVDGNWSTSPLPYFAVSGDEGSVYTDKDGSFDLSGVAYEIPQISGKYFSVRNRSGDNGWATWDDGDITLTDADASQAEIDSYVFLSQIREWLLDYGPDLAIATALTTSNVNISSACNAYYDGSVNFFQAGSGCNNTGRIADVNYHEWGHGLHAYAAGTWSVDGSIGEGAGDVTAFLQTGDSTIAPYFGTSGSGIRDVSANRVYPDDWTGQVHYDGLIFGGAVWDFWGLLAEQMPADEAQIIVSDLFVEALRDNFETDTAYDAFLAADDDNGDLGDGTPNMCALVEAFALHGLGPSGASSLVQLSHEPLGNQLGSAGDFGVEADLLNLAPECIDPTFEDARVEFSTDGGQTWDTADLSVEGDVMTGAIPDQPEGTVVWYYLAVDGGSYGEITAPAGGAINPFSFYVGEVDEIWCSDFEDDDGGFSSEELSGDDDWEWGAPMGEGGDPDFAWSGTRVWGNDLGDGRADGEYDDDAYNRLTSPSIDVGGRDQVIVQFARWLTVEDGYYDSARVLANDEIVWENHASGRTVGDEHHQDGQWALHTLAVDLGDQDQLTLAWEIESDAGLALGGWNIDDVCVYSISDPIEDTEDTGSEPPGADGGDESTSGCGCAASGSGTSLSLAAFLGLLGLLRRRSAG